MLNETHHALPRYNLYAFFSSMIMSKQKLPSKLRAQDVFILVRGSVEDYYPEGVSGPDKPSKAIHFCKMINTRELVLSLCGEVMSHEDGPDEKEFTAIFSEIFSN
jgi:hypothetical protein